MKQLCISYEALGELLDLADLLRWEDVVSDDGQYCIPSLAETPEAVAGVGDAINAWVEDPEGSKLTGSEFVERARRGQLDEAEEIRMWVRARRANPEGTRRAAREVLEGLTKEQRKQFLGRVGAIIRGLGNSRQPE